MDRHVCALDVADFEAFGTSGCDTDKPVPRAHDLIARRADLHTDLRRSVPSDRRHRRSTIHQELDRLAVDLAIDPEMAVQSHRNADLFALSDRLARCFSAQPLRDVSKIIAEREDDEAAS